MDLIVIGLITAVIAYGSYHVGSIVGFGRGMDEAKRLWQEEDLA